MEEKGKIFHGWWIVVASFLYMFAGIGIVLNLAGILITGILGDTSLNFEYTPLVLFITFQSVGSLIAAPFMGKILTKYNTQLVLIVCFIMTALGFVGFSFANQLTHFYIVGFFVGFFAMGTSTLPASILITNWFVEKRGMAMGIAFAGSGIGGMIMNPVIQSVISASGWRMGYIVMAIIFVLATIPITLLVVKLHPSQKGLKPLGADSAPAASGGGAGLVGLTLAESIKTPAFWVLGLTFFLICLTQYGTQTNIPFYLQSKGHSAMFTATAMSIYMGVLVLSKILYGTILDKFGPKLALLYSGVLYIVAAFLFLNAVPTAMPVVFAFLIIFALAVPYSTVFPSVATGFGFGTLDYGAIYGVLNIFLTAGLALTMPIIGIITGKTGSMDAVWYIFMGITVVLVALFWVFASVMQPKLKEKFHGPAA